MLGVVDKWQKILMSAVSKEPGPDALTLLVASTRRAESLTSRKLDQSGLMRRLDNLKYRRLLSVSGGAKSDSRSRSRVILQLIYPLSLGSFASMPRRIK